MGVTNRLYKLRRRQDIAIAVRIFACSQIPNYSSSNLANFQGMSEARPVKVPFTCSHHLRLRLQTPKGCRVYDATQITLIRVSRIRWPAVLVFSRFRLWRCKFWRPV